MKRRFIPLFALVTVVSLSRFSPASTTDEAGSQHSEPVYSDIGDVYMGGWGENGLSITATSLRADGPVPLLVTVASGEANRIGVDLENAWVGEWNGRMRLFESDEAGSPDIYLQDTATGDISHLISDASNEWHPSWDATGSHVVFDSDRAGSLDLYRIEVATGEIRRLTNHDNAEQVGRLSPDGRYLAFHRLQNIDGPHYEVYILDLESGLEVQVTRGPGDNSYPDWSPDGRLLAFSSNRDGQFGIYVICADRSNITKLTGGGDKYPKWSPDGRSIAYQSTHENKLALFLIRNPALPDCT